MAPVSKGGSKAREKGSCSQKFQLENAGLGEGKAGKSPATIHITMLPFPENTYLYLAPNVTLWRQCFWVNLSRIFETKNLFRRPLYSQREPVSLLYMTFWTTQTRLLSTLCLMSRLFDWCLLLPNFMSYLVYRTWSFFAVPYGQWNLWHTVSECDTAFNWDFQLEVHQYLSSYAFYGWVLHSQLWFFSVWLFWVWLGLILEGKWWCVMYSFFYLKRSCGFMQYGHLNQFITWQIHFDQGTETSNLQQASCQQHLGSQHCQKWSVWASCSAHGVRPALLRNQPIP